MDIGFATRESAREVVHLVTFGLNYHFNVLDIVTGEILRPAVLGSN